MKENRLLLQVKLLFSIDVEAQRKIEPFLGFVHSVQFGKPSLVCDFQELCRHLVDDFIIQHYLRLGKQNFVLKDEDYSVNRKRKREYLRHQENEAFIKELNKHFTSYVNISRIKVGEKQEIETLINEDAFLLSCKQGNRTFLNTHKIKI